jgi:hypothetical protein
VKFAGEKKWSGGERHAGERRPPDAHLALAWPPPNGAAGTASWCDRVPPRSAADTGTPRRCRAAASPRTVASIVAAYSAPATVQQRHGQRGHPAVEVGGQRRVGDRLDDLGELGVVGEDQPAGGGPPRLL